MYHPPLLSSHQIFYRHYQILSQIQLMVEASYWKIVLIIFLWADISQLLSAGETLKSLSHTLVSQKMIELEQRVETRSEDYLGHPLTSVNFHTFCQWSTCQIILKWGCFFSYPHLDPLATLHMTNYLYQENINLTKLCKKHWVTHPEQILWINK